MALIEYEGGDNYKYILDDGAEIILSDAQLQEITLARGKAKDRGFRSNSSLDILDNNSSSYDEDYQDVLS